MHGPPGVPTVDPGLPESTGTIIMSKGKSPWSPELQKQIDETQKMGKELLKSIDKLRITSLMKQKVKISNNMPDEQTLLTAIQYLHKLKNDINKAIKNILTVPGLEIQLEVAETQDHIPWLEVSVKQEIYP